MNIILAFLILSFSLIAYSYSKERETKVYPEGMDVAQAYYDAALRGELQTVKKEPFLISSLESLGRNPTGGFSEGSIYKDVNDQIWFVKSGQVPMNEYLGAKIMDLLIGPFLSRS